jgi:hypothetical protein
MKYQTGKLTALLIIAIALAMSAACGGNQIEEANKAVDEANKKLDDAKELLVKTETRNTDLFSANIQTVQQLQLYKSNKVGEAREIVGDYEKISEMLKDVAKRYDAVSRMNVSEKYKDYAKLKSDEFAKRSEAINIRKGNAQAFLEIDDPRMMTAKFDENNSKSDRLFKDAEDMGTRAKKMEEDNKDLFKQA